MLQVRKIHSDTPYFNLWPSRLILNLRGAYYGYHADRADQLTTGVGSSREAKFTFVTGTQWSTASQPFGHDKKPRLVNCELADIHQCTKGIYSFVLVVYNDDEWTAKQSDQSSELENSVTA